MGTTKYNWGKEQEALLLFEQYLIHSNSVTKLCIQIHVQKCGDT